MINVHVQQINNKSNHREIAPLIRELMIIKNGFHEFAQFKNIIKTKQKVKFIRLIDKRLMAKFNEPFFLNQSKFVCV